MKNSKIQWTNHTLNFWWGCTKVSPACAHCYAETVAKVFGKHLFGTVPQWGKGQPRYERLQAARKEALALNKEASKCRVIDDVVWIYTGSTQIIGEPQTFRVTASPRDIPLKKRELKDRREFTREEWDNAPKWHPRVFVNSMSDWLDNEVPIEWLADLLETLFLCPNLDFQLLTKRPENWEPRIEGVLKNVESSPEWETMEGTHATVKFRNWLADWFVLRKSRPHLWIGTTVENQEWADKRIPHLLKIPAKVRFLSCEPMLGPINLAGMEYFTAKLGRYPFDLPAEHRSSVFAGIHWVIAGGESGSQARPSHPDWFRSLRDQCQAAGVPFFFKQWGEFLPTGEHADHLPSNRRFRAEAMDDDGLVMIRPGTYLAGRLLDGQEWSQFPEGSAGTPARI